MSPKALKPPSRVSLHSEQSVTMRKQRAPQAWPHQWRRHLSSSPRRQRLRHPSRPQRRCRRTKCRLKRLRTQRSQMPPWSLMQPPARVSLLPLLMSKATQPMLARMIHTRSDRSHALIAKPLLPRECFSVCDARLPRQMSHQR